MSKKEKLTNSFINMFTTSLRTLRQSLLLRHDYLRQAARFSRNYSPLKPRTKAQFESRIIFLTHQIEKGLSHRDFRYGFGKKIFNSLPSMLTGLEKIDANAKNNFVYAYSISVLHEYVRRHQIIGYDLGWQKSLFSSEQWNSIINVPDDPKHACIEINRNDKLLNSTLPFNRLARNRHSIREFSNQKVTAEEIMDAVDLAMTTPSVCNRQPTRVHIVLNKKNISDLLRLQAGINGYPTPPALLVITSDLSAFMTEYERNEGYVDGGLFSMNLLYALESHGLGTCPLNTMFTAKVEKLTRNILQIPDNEIFVLYIAVGHFPEITRTCQSLRFSAKQITTIIK
ncbi:nitroreductase family protein [Bifidobacterium olomucense]|uniref:Nitroreductase n=1 Tax=Bifidobacterium olomucense TaxID=2675324 RepID=A0A7Y0EZ89_9BIFI|nr:nitroreductase family protein [Bifidobacterium sp. DSM 109959]NMM99129.1 nitroreductase [Bifidobacterium sp. DSM 109959]